MRKSVILPNGKNKSLFNLEKVALAASPLKSNYIKNEEKLSNDWGVLNYVAELPHIMCTDNEDIKNYMPIFFKLEKHNFEQEYRLFRRTNEGRVLHYSEEVLAKIILSPNIDKKSEFEIRKVMETKHPNIPILRAIEKMTEF